VQASDAQLRQGLEDVGALLWRGFYRVLHADLAIDCGDNLLNTGWEGFRPSVCAPSILNARISSLHIAQ
jgi:hypothetical protein